MPTSSSRRPPDAESRRRPAGHRRRPAERYQRQLSPARRALLVVLGGSAYLAAAGLTAVVLLDLSRWGVLGSAGMGLLVALCVVGARAALSVVREAAPAAGAPGPQGRRRPGR